MGTTCIPVEDSCYSCWYMAKPIQYCKVKKEKKKDQLKNLNIYSKIYRIKAKHFKALKSSDLGNVLIG